MNQLEKAISYAKNGIRIFPCYKNKAPLTKNGFDAATTDVETISKWWTKNPDALIGSPNDQFVVVDVDDYDISKAAKILTDYSITEMKKIGIDIDSSMEVRTLSGGKHLYFKKNTNVRRSIKALPNIDVLGGGGYVILPDQTNYVCKDDNPWDRINNLPEFDHELFSKVREELHELTVDVRKFGTVKTNKNKTKIKRKIVKDVVLNEDIKPKFSGNGFIDYDSDEIVFEINDGIYRRSDNKVKIDPTLKLLKNGKIKVNEGFFNKDKILLIFHNQEIQRKLAKLCGLRVPSLEKGRLLMKSVLPKHPDKRASMGVRWSEDKTHLIVRDFSNFYGDRFDQVDYNLVRLYAVQRYKTNVPRLKPAEFVTWLIRMLVEADIAEIDDDMIQKYSKDFTDLSQSAANIAEGIQTLDALKRLYDGYDGTTVFADKFAAAWCGVSPATANKAKKELVTKGYLNLEGYYDCSGGKRTDGFFNTMRFSINTQEEKNEALTPMAEQENTEENTVHTVIFAKPSKHTYENLVAFCVDAEIPNVVPNERFVIPLLISETFSEQTHNEVGTKYEIAEFTVDVLESLDQENKNRKILIGIANGPDILKFREELNKNYPVMTLPPEEVGLTFVISNDFDVDSKDVDLDKLDELLNKYIGIGYIDSIFTKFYESEDLYKVIDGDKV